MVIDKMRVVELKASAKEHGIKVYSKGYLERVPSQVELQSKTLSNGMKLGD